ITCGCCFSDFPLIQEISCLDNHAFCKTCIQQFAESKMVALRSPHFLPCPEIGGCTRKISDIDIQKCISTKVWAGIPRMRQMSDIETAQIPDLAVCPFCDFPMIIENADDKVFRRINPPCRAISCRSCREKSHIPHTCDEFRRRRDVGNLRNVVAEAQSAALIRHCPTCSCAVYKTSGCNKMTCPCGQMFCYIFRESVQNYGHF
ncbi:hypothetical protein DFJ77DRAFT_418209, partial [Powellomyces hirtus]